MSELIKLIETIKKINKEFIDGLAQLQKPNEEEDTTNMIAIKMKMPSKCSECPIEKQDVDSYTFADGWQISYYCPFVADHKKFYSVSNGTDHVRNYKRHDDCPLIELKETYEKK